jgi:hypothetical protein
LEGLVGRRVVGFPIEGIIVIDGRAVRARRWSANDVTPMALPKRPRPASVSASRWPGDSKDHRWSEHAHAVSDVPTWAGDRCRLQSRPPSRAPAGSAPPGNSPRRGSSPRGSRPSDTSTHSEWTEGAGDVPKPRGHFGRGPHVNRNWVPWASVYRTVGATEMGIGEAQERGDGGLGRMPSIAPSCNLWLAPTLRRPNT